MESASLRCIKQLIIGAIEQQKLDVEFRIEPLSIPSLLSKYNDIHPKQPGNEILWFKIQLYKRWFIDRIEYLKNDIESKQQDPRTLEKFFNNERLMKACICRYWNTVVRTLNEKVQTGIENQISYHREWRKHKSISDSRKLTDDQIDFLERWYLSHSENPYPSKEEKTRIAWHTHLLPQQVTNWFNNKRNRNKKETANYKRKREDEDERIEDSFEEKTEVNNYYCDSVFDFDDIVPNPGGIIEEFVIPDDNCYYDFN